MATAPVPINGRISFGAGLITCQTDPASGRDPADSFRSIPAIAAVAEQAGFDALWASEHHSADDGYLTSPLMALAAAAAVTQRLALGTAVCLAPLYHPARLAEDAQTLQLMSGNRLVLGLGIGYRDEEFEAFGIRRQRRGRIFEANVHLVRSLLGGDKVSHDEEGGYTTSNAFVRPVPAVPPPLWLGGVAAPAVERAARIADGYLVSRGPVPFVLQQLDVLDAARDGRPMDIGVPLTIAPTDLGWDVAAMLQGLLYTEAVYAGWSGRKTPDKAVADLQGTTDDIVGQLEPLLRRLQTYRSGHVFFRFVMPGLDTPQLAHMMQSMNERLLPRLRELVS
jgi:alkanesulfonate monooxygenase SsuD/methylene tetrahydromethanopterin reductase-like flavin-dependent oxidoreductase (luciferase family)